MPALSFQKQFVPSVESGEKTHSIRAYRKRPFRVGDTLALYTGMRTKHCRLLFRTVVTKIEDIVIHGKVPDMDRCLVEIDGATLARDEAEALAVRDGFRDHAHMMTWWLKNNGLPFRGQVIHWRNQQRKEEACQATRQSRSIGSRSTERVSGAASAAPSSSSTSASADRSASAKTTTNANAKGAGVKSSAQPANRPSASRAAGHAKTER